MAVFEESSRKIINEALSIGTTRGTEYADTWAIENQHPLFTDTIRKVVGSDDSRAANRMVRAAALVDTKISRIVSGGPYSLDSYVDLINYLAVLADLHGEYQVVPKPGDRVQSTTDI